MYVQGLSTGLPADIQLELYRSVKGFENVEIMRDAYAIEYECIDPLELFATLESKRVKGLYFAGQVNGTSGYEEAAAQGLVAGINAARAHNNKSGLIFPREGSYIGVMLDDLTVKGTLEPYRMMTSRAEYRLLLRQDTPIGYELGLVPKERYDAVIEKYKAVADEIARLEKTHRTAFLRRPEIHYADVAGPSRPPLPEDVTEQVEIRVKYEGYLRRQRALMEEMTHMENRELPEDTDYSAIQGLRLEAREKLGRVRPKNLGQASRVSGVNPADLTALMIWLRTR
jgi:tRNA uridine 5-carboxymethylaminomethyl modification enzyme